jgi:hypothetical protein
MRKQIGRAGLVSAMAIALGCAGVPPPVETIAAADVAVSEATKTDIQSSEKLELYLAKEHLAQSRIALEEERNLDSLRLAEMALVEAELAGARAEARVAEKNVAEIREHIDVLRAEIDRANTR